MLAITDTTAKSLFTCAPVTRRLWSTTPRTKAGSRWELLQISSFFLFNLCLLSAPISLLPIHSSDTSRPDFLFLPCADVTRACLACEPFWPKVRQLAPGELRANCAQAVTTTVNEIEHRPSCFLSFFVSFFQSWGVGLAECFRWRDCVKSGGVYRFWKFKSHLKGGFLRLFGLFMSRYCVQVKKWGDSLFFLKVLTFVPTRSS